MVRHVGCGSKSNGWVKVLPIALVAIGLCVLASACGTATSPSTVSTVSVTGAAPAVGSSSQYSAVANMSNGTTENVTTTAVWTSSNTDIATVSAGGLVTAVAEGTVSINATFENVTGSAQAAVIPAQVP